MTIDTILSLLPDFDLVNIHPESDFNDMLNYDKQWFLNNPGKKSFTRKPFAQDIAQFGACEKILVSEIMPGCRTRQPYKPKKKFCNL